MNAHLKGLKKKHEGLRDIAIADLQTYLDNQVAIGDHPHIGVAIEEKIEEISKHDGVIETIGMYGNTTNNTLPWARPVRPPLPNPVNHPDVGDETGFKYTGPDW